MLIGLASHSYIRQHTIDIAAGKIAGNADTPKIWVSSLESFGSLLNEGSHTMIDAVRTQNPQSIAELAGVLSREEADLTIALERMSKFGLVEFEEVAEGKKPIVNWTEIVIVPFS